MKKKIILSLLLVFVIAATAVIAIFVIKKDDDAPGQPQTPLAKPFGVWWWNDELDEETYLTFAQNNGVNEVYYCNSIFNDKTSNFIKVANQKGMKVYWLAGEYKWLDNSENLISKVNEFVQYQNNFDYDFEGVHLDIEPHQHPDFDSKRNELITKLVAISNELKQTYSSVKFEYDIPFWLDDEISYGGQTKQAFKFMIDYADRIFLMSYRDTAQKIYDVSKDEIEYAKAVDKTLVLGVETKENEIDIVSFFEEGKSVMNEEIKTIQTMLPNNFGICVHHIKSWFDLKN